MIYKNYVSKITEALKKYKNDIDMLEKSYHSECEKVRTKANNMKGKWTDEYCSEYIKENIPDSTYKAKMQSMRAKAEPTVLHYLEMLKKSLDGYFNAPVRSDFANKIMTIQMTGLQLSNLEFSILSDSVSSYMEARLLNQLGLSRTKAGVVTELDSNGVPHSKKADVLNPYYNKELPNIEETYNAFDNYKNAAKSLLYSYSGDNAEMSHLLEEEIPRYVSVSMDSYFRTGHEKAFLRAMDKCASILPESKVKLTLNENDKALIDLLIDSKYPSLAKDRVKELALADSHIASLLALDERYSGFLEEE